MVVQQQVVSMVDFPARTVLLGSSAHTPSEEPPHPVELRAFGLADRCVSAAEFHAFLLDAPGAVGHTWIDCIDPCFVVHSAAGFELRPGCGAFPMIQINYWAAAAYCNWLSRREGLPSVYDLAAGTSSVDVDGYRLPTEAEWESACRDGFPTPSPVDSDRVNSADAGPACRRLRAGEQHLGAFLPDQPAPVPVASLPADAAGLFEMLGNVREWCHDRYGPYAPGLARNPTGAGRGFFRVVRGGSFVDPGPELGPERRMAAHEDTRCEVYGFRVARSR